ncbi:nucleoside triphosphate pyrophosphohydrolase [Porphyromonas levii]|uniref:nucleoside triphosphate pyrophosphohydrolase n=1 Tax=Porphyromonas levii TaxID=28114 RepID=UPI001B8BCED2|nr:nucleoside triphosphate pyrophosphohydrolase [Porphyromonas levii]MBR8712973.1 Nucleoside triphosphate pyrophosphohydrolase [Porphyromonas levii]MBR8715020.1 Nucleoside triphosphate pyrophosphohydrolase [Porphyromonas levii]MBR8727505.1 Nucleoside triphosphate pyrophosphohydrolase [Porphyromonas levii]MBR8735840.1 Nucleoside triphosphate pyrophosphohydrolase [Porphyromonas levii]MBR8774164.1 Nucleoside triphosphate pyrophosphohydrolase [Porphyromonas levii]
MSAYKKSTREEKLEALGHLLDVLDRLRVECPWDAKQTNLSLRPNTIEEVFELSEALLHEDDREISKELGDVLLHVLFYAKIGEEKEAFDIASVAHGEAEKLIYRHPHIYGSVQVNDAHDVEQNWEQIKLKEKGGNKTVLSGVPSGLPSMIKAYRVQEKAANVGFDWEQRSDVWDKVEEELRELRQEIEGDGTQAHKEGELGDFLFSLINMGRLYGVDPDTSLERTNQKFIRRFGYIEERAKAAGKSLKEMTLGEMDALWNEAKRSE